MKFKMIYIRSGKNAKTVVTESILYFGAKRLVNISKNPSFKSKRFKVTKGDYKSTRHIPIY